MFLSAYLMYVTICNLGDWFFFSLYFFHWRRCFRRRFFRYCCSNFPHKFLLLFLLFQFIFVNFRLFCFLLLFFIFWLTLTKITIKLIPTGATLLIILIGLLVLKISKIVLTLILPKGILLLIFFHVHKVIHFCSSSLSETHLFYSIILRRQRLLRWFLLGTFLIFWRLVVTIFLNWALIIFIRSLFIIRGRNFVAFNWWIILIHLGFFNFVVFTFFLLNFVLLYFFFVNNNFFTLL